MKHTLLERVADMLWQAGVKGEWERYAKWIIAMVRRHDRQEKGK